MATISLAMLAPANSVHTHRWANALSEYMNVTLYSLEDHPAKEGDLKKEIEVYYLPSGGKQSYFTAPRRLRALCKDRHHNVYNVHYASGYGTLMRLAKLYPSVMNFWGSDIYEFPHRSPLHKWILKRNIAHASKIVSTSRAMKEEIHRVYGYKMGEISVIPFGVDLNRFPYRKRTLPEKTLKMGTCKILDKLYALDDMIHSFSKVVPFFEGKGIDPQLHLYGDGPQRSALEELAGELGLKDKVTFHGWIQHQQIPKVLDQLDLFLLSSHRESFGVSAIEAMAMGLPVIATETQGFCEVIEKGKSGVLVPIKNPELMAKAIMDLYEHKELYTCFSEEGRRRVEQNYNWENNVKAMVELLQQTKR